MTMRHCGKHGSPRNHFRFGKGPSAALRFLQNRQDNGDNRSVARNPLPGKEEILDQLEMVSCPCTDPVSLVAAVGIAAELRNKRKFNRADK